MNSKAILCVDDEPMVLHSLREQISRHFGQRYRCELAESADEALDLIAEMAEDEINILLVVSDWLMPGMKGDELLVKVHERFPGIVKVMLTGQADRDAVDRARQKANLLACLQKPWDEKTLVDLIKQALGDENPEI